MRGTINFYFPNNFPSNVAFSASKVNSLIFISFTGSAKTKSIFAGCDTKEDPSEGEEDKSRECADTDKGRAVKKVISKSLSILFFLIYIVSMRLVIYFESPRLKLMNFKS